MNTPPYQDLYIYEILGDARAQAHGLGPHYLGLWLEDRWSRWSPRLVYFRQRGRVMLALGLCVLPVVLMAVLAQRSMAHRRILLQQLWVMQRSSWHVSTAQTLARYLESLQVTTDVSSLEVRRLLDQPEALQPHHDRRSRQNKKTHL